MDNRQSKLGNLQMTDRQKLLQPLSAIGRYAWTVLAVVCTLTIRLALDPMLGDRAPYLFFLLMIVVVKRFWGRGPGLLATLLGGIASWYFIIEPRFSFTIGSRFDALNLAGYFVVGVGISFLGEASGRLPSALTLGRGNINLRVVRQTAVLACAVLVLAGMVLLLLRDFRRSQEAEHLVAHTYQVMNSAESVLSAMKDAESGERGYMLTGDKRYLAPYNSAIAALPIGLKELKDQTSDNPHEQVRLGEINRLTDERLSVLKHAIELRTASKVDAALALVRYGRGEPSMDQLRSSLDAVMSEERRLLAERTARVKVEASRGHWVLGLGSAAMILLLVFASMVIERETVRREEITEDLRRHADLLEQAHDCLLICRLRGAIEYWSHGAEILFGYSREEAVERSSHELLQTYHPLGMAWIDAMLERDGEWKGELTETAKDGRKLIVESQWTVVVDAKGNKIVLQANRDITERKQAEERLHESETQFRTLANAIPQLCWMANADGWVFWYNDQWYEYTGTTPEQMAGWGWQSVHDPEALPKVLESWKDSIATGKPFDMVFPLRGADGVFRSFLTRVKPVCDQDGRVTRWFGTNTDISEQRRIQKELRESEALLRSFFDNPGMMRGMVELVDGRIIHVYCNEAAAQLYGLDRKSIAGKNATEAGASESVTRTCVALYEKARSTGKPVSGEYARRDSQGTERWLLATASYMGVGQSGNPRFAYTILDLTEHRRAEEALRESEARLRTLGDNLPEGAIYRYRLDANRQPHVDFISAGIERLTGVPAAKFMTDPSTVIRNVATEDRERLTAAIALSAEHLTRFEVEVRHKHRATGETHWSLLRSSPTQFPDGSIVWDGIEIDITERKLAEAQNVLLATAIEQAAETVVITDRDATIQYANPAFTRTTGYTRGEAIGQNPRLLKSGQHDAKFYQEMWATLTAGKLWHGEITNRHKAGTLYTEEATIAPVRNASGEITHYIAIKSDITERKQAEEALRLSEEHFRSLFDHMLNGFAFCQMLYKQNKPYDFIYLSVNKAFEALTGLKNVEGKKVSQVIPGIQEADPVLIETYGRVASTGVPQRFETYVEALAMWFSIAVYSPKKGYFVAVFDVITERKQAEKALEESELRYRQLFERSESAVVLHETVFDQQGSPSGYRCLDLNPACERIMGVSRAQVLGRCAHEVFAELGEFCTKLFGRVAATEEPVAFEDYSRTMDRYFAGSAYSPRPNQYVVTFMDVTERRRAEKALHVLNAELEERVRSRTAELESANRELEAFAHSVSHDLRAPLRGIDGWSQALLEDYGERLDAQGHKYLDRVRSEAQRMGTLIDDLLHLSRVGRAELVPSTVDFTSLAKAIIARLKEVYPDRPIEFIVAPQLKCTGDARLLEIALTNLLANAVKFTGQCTHALIEFGKCECEDNPAFFVRDNGVGFDMAYSKMLFAPFQRLHKASEFPGTGIGLATVQRVIHRHGGRIWAEAKVGAGATFYFTLGAGG